MLTIWTFDNKENKHSLYWEDCMKKFSKPLKEHTQNMIDFQKKKMLPLTKKALKLYQYATECHICRKKLIKKVCRR